MSNDNSNANSPPESGRNRRGSVTSAAFTNLFQRSSSTSASTAVFPGAITSAAINDQRRRLSISTLGLSGSSPTNQTNPLGLRRGSISTNNSDSIDESAVEEDDSARTAPNTPFTRRMSFGANAMRNMRTGGSSPGSSNDQGFNWSEQLRSRAESSVATGSRPSFSLVGGLAAGGGSPPRTAAGGAPQVPAAHHDRAKSVSDMPAPPAQPPKPAAALQQKPDHFQERILKGDFYMD